MVDSIESFIILTSESEANEELKWKHSQRAFKNWFIGSKQIMVPNAGHYIYQYRKHAYINYYRALILYSFLLYLITAYYLIILPLPKTQDVLSLQKTGTKHIQLVPFNHNMASGCLNYILMILVFLLNLATMQNIIVYFFEKDKKLFHDKISDTRLIVTD